MKHTPENILALAQKTAESLIQGAWPAFLRTAAWNFKYDFTSQLLIFAQKPDATACAPYDLWTSAPFHRRPMKGRAIALLADDAPNSDLRYVFDISDTVVKKSAPDPANPVWEVTPQKEPAIRKALAEAFLPYEQQTELHLASDPSDFYRSVAFSIVRTHYEDFFKSDKETERTVRNLLTESVSAMLQFRCGRIPEVNEDILAQIKNFQGIDAISTIGRATQSMARIGLLEVSHAVHAWDAQHKGHDNAANRGEGAADAGFDISEADITRALTAGPPLEYGKFRLQQAAKDPKLTSEALAETLRREYGTGRRPFLLASGIHGTLSWGSEGLKIERNGLQECVHLTLDWKTASERLKWLADANLYLDRSEEKHMKIWSEAQNALLERQKTGAEASALLTALVPTHPDLHLFLEYVRAYIYENSEATCRQLADTLQNVRTLDTIQNDPSAQSLLNALIKTISNSPVTQQANAAAVPAEGEGSPGAAHPEGTYLPNTSQGTQKSSPITAPLENKAKSDLLYSKNSKENSGADCTAMTRKGFYFADKMATEGTGHTLLAPVSPSETNHSAAASEQTKAWPTESLIDHPELRQKELHRLDRSDKVALTDLLYHYTTYRYIFNAHTPELCVRDAASREEQLATLDAMLVSQSVDENLKNIRQAKTILARWFLPFEGIRPDILAEQEKLIAAAEQVLSDPPEQSEEYAHNYVYDYNYTHNKPVEPVRFEEDEVELLWDQENGGEGQKSESLSDKIQSAQSRSLPASASPSRSLLEIGT